jgi:hypothetical protein
MEHPKNAEGRQVRVSPFMGKEEGVQELQNQETAVGRKRRTKATEEDSVTRGAFARNESLQKILVVRFYAMWPIVMEKGPGIWTVEP